MKRFSTLLAIGLAALALLIVAYGGVHASRLPVHARAASAKALGDVKLRPVPNSNHAQDEDQPVIRFVKNPESIPLFLARDVEGNVISTAAYKGKIVLVNFWATWCPPCREEIPEMIHLQEEFKDELQILSVSEDDAPPEAMHAFAKSARINYPIVIMTPEIESDFGGVAALPTSFLVSKEGGIVTKHVGFYPIEVFEREIRALAGMQFDARIETFEDTGQIFLKNAVNATELPGVDLSHLSPQQKQIALRRLNSETCTCGCRLTLAQCRINDTACPMSRELAAKIVKEILAGKTNEPPSKSEDSSSTD